jgi:hypothetical protein
MHGTHPKPRVRPRHIKTFSPVLKTSRLPHLREAFRNLGDPPASQMEQNVISPPLMATAATCMPSHLCALLPKRSRAPRPATPKAVTVPRTFDAKVSVYYSAASPNTAPLGAYVFEVRHTKQESAVSGPFPCAGLRYNRHRHLERLPTAERSLRVCFDFGSDRESENWRSENHPLNETCSGATG